MKNVPVSIRDALNRRGRQDILDREGDYSQYEAEIQQIIHGEEAPSKQPLVPDMGDRYEEELTPEESKAQDRIEELGKQYAKPVTADEPNPRVNETKMFEEPSERDQDIAKIKEITDRINSYDADSAEGYLTTDESELIKDLAQKHKLTADDLKKIGGRVFDDYDYGTDEFAYKEPSPEEQKESVNKELRESLKLPGDIVEDLKLSDEQYKILNEWLLKTKRM